MSDLSSQRRRLQRLEKNESVFGRDRYHQGDGYVQHPSTGHWFNPMNHLDQDERQIMLDVVDEMVDLRNTDKEPSEEQLRSWDERMEQIRESAILRILSNRDRFEYS